MSDRNKKVAGYALVCVLTMIIGFFIAMQIKTTAVTGDYAGGMVSLAQAQASISEVANLRAEKDELNDELSKLEAQLKEYEKNSSEAAAADAEKYRMLAGLTDVAGKGVVITVDDPEAIYTQGGDSIITYNYELLLALVNKLREAGAEAISINDRRITAYSEISLAGSNININGSATAPPYEVKAIGDPQTLESTLGIRYGVLYSMKNDYGLSVQIAQKSEINIPRYTGRTSFKYAAPTEGE